MVFITLLTFLPPWLSGLVFAQLGPTTFSTRACTVYKAIAPITVPMAILVWCCGVLPSSCRRSCPTGHSRCAATS